MSILSTVVGIALAVHAYYWLRVVLAVYDIRPFGG